MFYAQKHVGNGTQIQSCTFDLETEDLEAGMIVDFLKKSGIILTVHNLVLYKVLRICRYLRSSFLHAHVLAHTQL
jgi:hypothetical protein